MFGRCGSVGFTGKPVRAPVCTGQLINHVTASGAASPERMVDLACLPRGDSRKILGSVLVITSST